MLPGRLWDAGDDQGASLGQRLAPLTGVAAVCRVIEGMNDAAQLISEFLDGSALWTIPRVCEQCPPGSLRLLERIAAREDSAIPFSLKFSIFTLALVKAIEKDNFEAVQWLVEEYSTAKVIRDPVNTAVRLNRLGVLRWLRANHYDRVVWESSLVLKARASALETIKWVHENVAPIDRSKKRQLMVAAVLDGAVDKVEWLNSLDLPFVQPDLVVAVRSGSIELVEWIRDHTDAQFDEDLVDLAVQGGDIAMAQWLHSNFGLSMVLADAIVQGIARMCFTAIRDDDIKWMLEHLTISNKEELARAIDSLSQLGSFEDIKRIHAISGEGRCSTNAMDTAAGSGRLDLVQWLHENRHEGCTTGAMDGAARHGHLDILKWLHENRREGCTIDAMKNAVVNGHLDTVKWLLENRSEGWSQ